MNKSALQNILLFVILGLLVMLLIAIFSPYTTVLFWSVILYIMCVPLYKTIVSKLNPDGKAFSLKCKLLAGVFAVTTVVLISAILLFFLFLVLRQCISLTDKLRHLLLYATPQGEDVSLLASIDALFENLTESIYDFTNKGIDLRHFDIKSILFENLSKYTNTIFNIGQNLVKSAGAFLISLVFVCFSLYFFYVDGTYLTNLLRQAIPIEHSSMNRIVAKFTESVSQLVFGLLLVALYQASAALLVFTIFKVEGSVLLAVGTFFGSFIPLIGSGIIWVPIAIVLFFTVSKVKGILFFIVAGTVISLLDNILRPLILKDTIKIHPLLIFFSLLGGVKVLGFKGVILGPMAIIIFFTVLELILNNGEQETEVATTDVKTEE